MQGMDILVQGEGRPTISRIQVKQDATIEEPVVAAITQEANPMAVGRACLMSLEEADGPLTPGVTLTTAGISHRSRVHPRRADGSILQMEV
jgi:hypothetical protein